MAITFASGDYIERPSSADMDNVYTGTIAFWLKTTQTTGHAGVVGRARSGDSANGFTVLLNNATAGKVTMAAKVGASYVLGVEGATTVNDGNWRHIAIEWNSANGQATTIYVDGASDGSANCSLDWASWTQPLRLGQLNDPFWPGFVGEIAEFGWWGVELGPANIAALAKGFRPPRVNQAALNVYMPLVRDIIDYRAAGATVSGTSVSDHPRVFG